jgi:hypothetical protein
MRKTWVLIAALGLALAGRASAQPSFFGPTGLLIIPTANTLDVREWNVHVHALERSDSPVSFGVSAGIAKQFELGVTGYNTSLFGTKALFNMKYNFLQETAVIPGIAVGGFDIGAQLPHQDSGVYVVGSKSFAPFLKEQGPLAKLNLSGHVGYGANNIFHNNPFGGIAAQLPFHFQAMGEWLDGHFYYGGRYSFGTGVRAEVGSYHGHFGGGVSYAAALP